MENSLFGRDLLSIGDLSAQEMAAVLATAEKLKRGKVPQVLAGESIALLFEKPSLRTKVSFDVAIHELGGHPTYLGQGEVGLGKRESIADVARTLSRYVHGLVARTFAHQSIVDLAQYADVPLINALSDTEHPCQVLADLLTMQQHGKKLGGVRVAFIGDGNNVAASLAQAITLVGGHFILAAPQGFELPSAVASKATENAARSGGSFSQIVSPHDALGGADVVYTDVWTSMGQEAGEIERAQAFRGYTVDSELMALAKHDAIFMHDLPAHRGAEVLDEVIDGAQSVVFDQAENRLHAQRALLALIFGASK